jgi:hypothetical protein
MSRSHNWIGKWTRQKEQDFAGLVGGIHVPVCAAIHGRLGRAGDPPYVFIDLHAGPGRLRDDTGATFPGSPVIAADALASSGIPHETWHFERDPGVAAELSAALDPCVYPDSSVCNVDFENGIAAWLQMAPPHRYRNGLVFADPIGLDGSTGPVPVEVFNAVAQHSPRVDLLAYVAANNHYKRSGQGLRIADDISAVRKRKVLVREPDGAEQYTFILWTNWDRVPEWHKSGFYDLASARGQEILSELNFTTRERKERAEVTLW